MFRTTRTKRRDFLLGSTAFMATTMLGGLAG